MKRGAESWRARPRARYHFVMEDPKAKPEDAIEIKCPTCKERVVIARKDAERAGRAACSKGHDIPLVAAF
jgi:hypothetical protein